MGFEDAVAHHRAGQLEAAETAYRGVVQAHPDHGDAWQLLGLVLHRLERPDEALAAMERALALDDTHAPTWANRGLVLRALGQHEAAAASFRRAVALRPGFAEPLVNLARLEAQRGRGQQALEAARQAGAHPEALRLRGMLAANLGALDEAREAWAEAFAQHPDPALGRALGQLALQQGRPSDAVGPLSVALGAGAPVGPLLADALVQGGEGVDEATLVALLGDPTVDAQRLQRAVRTRLAALPAAARTGSPLLRPWLERCLVQHPDDLAQLAGWRQEARERGDVGLAAALAVQAWFTEYADPVDDAETAAVAALAPGPLRVALSACASPQDVPDVPSLRTLHRVAVLEPAEERALLASVPSLTPIVDATSQDVAAMYEANPYPRRVGVHRPPKVPLDSILTSVGAPRPEGDPLRVLVAGAGTGQHPLQTATRYADVEVLAIDLSRASLARAVRVARTHHVDNVRFAQADLLALALDERFSVIESVGVLHHLQDPLAGWRVLVDHLAPDGVMRIGLYAERGRADVVAARACVDAWGLEADPAGLREARRRLLALPEDHPAHPVVWSPDFPSLSGLRDLVFHVCEHRFTLPQLSEHLTTLGLLFYGFQHSRPEPSQWYRERWPEDRAQRDLARWDALERSYPRAFSGMYVFWCGRAAPVALSGD